MQKSAQRIEKILKAMTLNEKARILSGLDCFETWSIPRLGVESMVVTDGPHAVCAVSNMKGHKRIGTTFFPTGTGMAATWDPRLVRDMGKVMGAESAAHGYSILLGPAVNMIRTPLAGRNFEGMGEDPCLTGAIGVGYVKGVQSQGVGTSLKHYACNNQEVERLRGSSEVDERTLREIYLPHFEQIVKEAKPWTVMCSYNRLNGVYASENRYLLTQLLREEWGFDGMVLSDWDAVHASAACIKAGLDLEMPGPPRYFGKLLVDAVRTWQLDEDELDMAVRRYLSFLQKVGKLSGGKPPEGALNTPRHQAVARKAAEGCITLLKNADNILPLDAKTLNSLAVIGPNAVDVQVGGGGSSSALPHYRVSPLDGLKEILGKDVKIRYAKGCDNAEGIPSINADYTTVGQCFFTEFYQGPAFKEKPDMLRSRRNIGMVTNGNPPTEGIEGDSFAVRWSGVLRVPETGTYRLTLDTSGSARIMLDGKTVLTGPSSKIDLPLKRGERHPICVEFIKTEDDGEGKVQVNFGIPPNQNTTQRIHAAAELAARSDVAVVVVGMPFGGESEGGDRKTLALPCRQDDLIRAVSRANPNTIVVINAGAPITMPWLDNVAGVVFMFYAGMEGGRALAEILAGTVNPSGKLPMTFPKRLEDNPSCENYPGGRSVCYGERIYVGYRYYDARKVEPLFPFGHGLSYTSFDYTALRVPAKVKQGADIPVSVVITNTGARAGKEVAQLYVHDVAASVDRPPKELKAFAKVALKPGQSKTLTFTLTPRDLSFYDVEQQRWVAEPGTFEIQLGSSSRDIRITRRFELR